MEEPRSYSRTSILIVPILAVVGLLSPIFTLGFWFTFTSEYQGKYLFPLLQSLILGEAVSAVLWGFGYIRRWITFIGVVAAVIAAHLLEQFLDPRLPQQTLPCWDCLSVSFFTSEVAIRFFIASSIVFVASLGLIEPRPKVPWILIESVGSSMLGSVALGIFDAWGKSGLVFNGTPLWLLWQPTMATFLGVAVWAGSLSSPTSLQVSSLQENEPRVHNRFLALYVLGFFILIIEIWGGALAHRQKDVADKRADWIKFQIERSVQERPPLARLLEDPASVEDVMETTGLDDWKMYIHEAHRLSAQTSGNKPVLPDREQYTAYFAKANNDRPVSVTITQFPNSAWAHFELRNTPMQSAFFTQYGEILRIATFGGILYQDGPYLYWSSGDKLILLDCSGTLPPDINLFLKAYTHKYPSSIEHSDVLEQLVAP
jgi:hypothetical protein